LRFSDERSGRGVGLVDAVGASCAVPRVWPPVTIGERRFMDGGMRTVANADLARGYERAAGCAPIRLSCALTEEWRVFTGSAHTAEPSPCVAWHR
jgi:predicted acylesterase/phospholipase RssA